MKNIIFSLIALSVVCISCSKKDEVCSYKDSVFTASSSEIANLESYLATTGITGAQKHSSGFYYKITQQGSGNAVVNLCSDITIKYMGRLTNGTVFDQSPAGGTTTFTLGGLIPGWQKGIPLISSGGKITLYNPPSLGYGSVDVKQNNIVIIPANSILIFEIDLVAVS